MVNDAITVPPSVSQPKTRNVFKLRDGSQVDIRAVTTRDEAELCSFLEGLCLEARRMRFFSTIADMRSSAHWAAHTDACHHGLVAHDSSERIVGHALYVKLNDTHAEVAVEVGDDLHGQGLGTLLIEQLAVVAEQHGITHFVAVVLAENQAMLDVFREGFDGRVTAQQGPEKHVEFLTSGWRLAHQRFHSTQAGSRTTQPRSEGGREKHIATHVTAHTASRT